MDDKADMEHCSITDTICPYEHGCTWCLHNDYEEAKEKARRIEEELARGQGAE